MLEKRVQIASVKLVGIVRNAERFEMLPRNGDQVGAAFDSDDVPGAEPGAGVGEAAIVAGEIEQALAGDEVAVAGETDVSAPVESIGEPGAFFIGSEEGMAVVEGEGGHDTNVQGCRSEGGPSRALPFEWGAG